MIQTGNPQSPYTQVGRLEEQLDRFYNGLNESGRNWSTVAFAVAAFLWLSNWFFNLFFPSLFLAYFTTYDVLLFIPVVYGIVHRKEGLAMSFLGAFWALNFCETVRRIGSTLENPSWFNPFFTVELFFLVLYILFRLFDPTTEKRKAWVHYLRPIIKVLTLVWSLLTFVLSIGVFWAKIKVNYLNFSLFVFLLGSLGMMLIVSREFYQTYWMRLTAKILPLVFALVLVFFTLVDAIVNFAVRHLYGFSSWRFLELLFGMLLALVWIVLTVLVFLSHFRYPQKGDVGRATLRQAQAEAQQALQQNQRAQAPAAQTSIPANHFEQANSSFTELDPWRMQFDSQNSPESLQNAFSEFPQTPLFQEPEQVHSAWNPMGQGVSESQTGGPANTGAPSVEYTAPVAAAVRSAQPSVQRVEEHQVEGIHPKHLEE